MAGNESTNVVRDRMIRAATELFVASGYKATSTRKICEMAEANNAMVSYYFGSKEKLYLAAFEYARALEIRLGDGAQDDVRQASPEVQLRAAIECFLRNLLMPGPGSSLAKLIAKELIDPSGVIDSIVENDILPQHRRLGAIVRGVAKRTLSDAEVRRFIFSIIGQCLFYWTNRPINELVAPEIKYDEMGVSETAAHIHQFTLAALARV